MVAREDRAVDPVLEVVVLLLAGFRILSAETSAVEDHGAARAAQGFVGRCGYDVGVGKGRGDGGSSDKAGDVRHVGEEVSIYGVRNLPHRLVLDQAAVGRSPSDEYLRAIKQSELGKFGVVD